MRRDAGIPAKRVLATLDATAAVTDNCGNTSGGATVEVGNRDELQETVDRLRVEVADLLASRRRLVIAADADRRTIERDLHQGVQQHLVGLSVAVQLAASSIESDPASARGVLEALGRDVQEAVDAAAELAQRIYPPLLQPFGLGSALRAAAATAGLRLSLEVPDVPIPPDVAGTIYRCCLETLRGARSEARIDVRDVDGVVSFDVTSDGPAGPRVEALRDGVEALGGQLLLATEPGGGSRISGSLPR